PRARVQGAVDPSADRAGRRGRRAGRPPAGRGWGAPPPVRDQEPSVKRADVIAVDGGGSKTDLALVARDGSVLAVARGPQSSPHHIGVERCLGVLETLLSEARREAGLEPKPAAEVAELLMAGVDFPAEEETLRQAVAKRGWARDVHVGNDTFAILRAGTERGWGVAVPCGAGI